jgi:hypothetical protein
MPAPRAPRRRSLIDQLDSAIAAEARAAAMRDLHGADAERACDALIAADSGGDQREHLKDVRRALRWV